MVEVAFQAEVSDRIGVLPNFFRTADAAPGLISELWAFTKSGYLDNPLPSLFKERLFVHLWRFCTVRYCIVRHAGFLIGLGRPAGDASAVPHSIQQVVEMLRRPGIPDKVELDAAFSRMGAFAAPGPIPDPETREEEDIFAAATVIFLEPAPAERPIEALRRAIGALGFELVAAFLAFVHTAHYWTVTHPELTFEDDVNALLHHQQELAQLLLDQSDASRNCIGRQLFDELVQLRRERDERDALRRLLAERQEAQRHQQLLINELNHRVKNTLVVVQSIAAQTLRSAKVPRSTWEVFNERLMALAQAHDVLTEEKWESARLQDIVCRITDLHRNSDGSSRFVLDGPEARIGPSMALSLSMVIHELATNAAKYGALSSEAGHVEIRWNMTPNGACGQLTLTWKEVGGPNVVQPSQAGFGTRLIGGALAEELDGEVHISYAPSGVICDDQCACVGELI